jgi:hypothetical protein
MALDTSVYERGDVLKTEPKITVSRTLIRIAKSPIQSIILCWNWKAALMSALIRAGIFFFTTLSAGRRQALTAMLAEAVFAAALSGVLGAITQQLRNAQPEWLTGTIVSVVMPAILQFLQYWLHLALRTPHLRAGMIGTFIFSAVAMLFNWFAMRRGTLLTAGEGQSFGRDLIALPHMAGLFLLTLPRAIWKLIRKNDQGRVRAISGPSSD